MTKVEKLIKEGSEVEPADLLLDNDDTYRAKRGPILMPSKTPTMNRPYRAVIIPDPVAVQNLIELLIIRSGANNSEVARMMGVKVQSLNQYRSLKRRRPSIQWLCRLAHACGARIVIEWGDGTLGEREGG